MADDSGATRPTATVADEKPPAAATPHDSWEARLYSGETSYPIVAKRRTWYTISLVMVIISIAAFAFKGLNLGIEFSGGTVFEVRPRGELTVPEARDLVVEATGITSEPVVTEVGGDALRIQTESLDTQKAQAAQDALAKAAGVPSDAISRTAIGPSWGEQITRRALLGLLAFLVVVSLFLMVRFEPKMSVGAIVALLHDVIITAGVYALIGFEVTPATTIGLLTILAYSLYDTVVVYDKVRENTASIAGGSRMTYSQAANLALNQTLVRSINTSVIAVLPVISILFVGVGLLGAGTLKDLALVLLVGTIAGSYSSLFLAVPVVCDLKEREPAMQALAKRVAARQAAQTAGRPAKGGAPAAAAGAVEPTTQATGDAGTAAATPRPKTSGGGGAQRQQPKRTTRSGRRPPTT
jgi:preprotein translocase subunit SecF